MHHENGVFSKESGVGTSKKGSVFWTPHSSRFTPDYFLTGCQYDEGRIVRCREVPYVYLKVKNNAYGLKNKGDWMDWYLLRSKPRQEVIAETNIQRWGVESFCPQLMQTKIIRGKKQTVISPLFPGYLFSRFNLSTDYRKVAYAHGVADVVTFGTTPARVDEEIIETIRARMHEGFVSLSPPLFISGQTVQIQEGPLKGLLAVFERELTGTQRVALLLKNVSYSARVVIEREWVSAVGTT